MLYGGHSYDAVAEEQDLVLFPENGEGRQFFCVFVVCSDP